MQIRTDQLGEYYIDEIISLTVVDASPDTVTLVAFTLPQAFRNTPIMQIVPPQGIAASAFTLAYVAGTPSITVTSTDLGTVSFGGKVIQCRLIAVDQS